MRCCKMKNPLKSVCPPVTDIRNPANVGVCRIFLMENIRRAEYACNIEKKTL